MVFELSENGFLAREALAAGQYYLGRYWTIRGSREWNFESEGSLRCSDHCRPASRCQVIFSEKSLIFASFEPMMSISNNFFRYIFEWTIGSWLARQFNIRNAKKIIPTPNPTLERQYVKSRKLTRQDTLALLKELGPEWTERKVERWFRHKRNLKWVLFFLVNFILKTLKINLEKKIKIWK